MFCVFACLYVMLSLPAGNKGINQPIQSNSTSCPKHQTGNLRRHKIKTVWAESQEDSYFPEDGKKSKSETWSILRGCDRNSTENYDNVNTIPTKHLFAQSYIWAAVSVISVVCWWNICANIYSICLTRVRRISFNWGAIGYFHRWKWQSSFILQEIKAFMSENVFMKN